MAYEPIANGGAIKYTDSKYHMNYEAAFKLFCDITVSGQSNNTIKVWNYRSDGNYNSDAPDEILTWNTGTVQSPTVGKYFVITDYKTKVKDPYEGVYGTQPRYRTLLTDKGYQLGFEVPASWSYDGFPQKVNVELFEQNNSFNLVSTGMTGIYTLCNLGLDTIQYPQWMSGGVWSEIHEWVDNANATGTLLRVAYSNVSMPFDWTSIVFLRYKILSNGVFAYPSEGWDDPTVENTAAYIFNLAYEKVKASADEADKWMGFDWYLTEAQLYTMAVNASVSPVSYWKTASGANLNIQAQGTRMFGVMSLIGSATSWPKTSLPTDIGSIALMQVTPGTYGYSYTFPAAGAYPTITESGILQMSHSSLQEVNVSEFTPAPNMIDGVRNDSTIYGLPNTIIFRADLLKAFRSIYVGNSNIVVKNTSEMVECQQLWTSLFSGTLNNLLFRSPAAYMFIIADIDLTIFLLDTYISSLYIDASYRFFFESIIFKNITFDEAQKSFTACKFATARTDTLYEVRIFGSFGFSNITGGPSPFTISEENTKYAFEPIRDQSGYIQLLNQNSTQRVKQIIPEKVTDRPVALYDIANDKYVWMGYIKPEVFESDPFAYREIVRLPIIGLTYAARSIEFSAIFPQEKDMTVGAAIATAIYQMMAQHPVKIEYVVFDYAIQFFGSSGGVTIPLDQSWMKAKINTTFFREQSEEGESWAYDCASVLKTFCEFFGLTIRIHGTAMYFLALDDVRNTHRLGQVRFSSLVATGFVDDFEPTVTTVNTAAMRDVFAGDFSSTDTRETLTPAVREVSVKCDVKTISDSITLWGEWVTKDQWSRIISGSYPSSSFEVHRFTDEEGNSVYGRFRLYPIDGNGYSGWQPQLQAICDKGAFTTTVTMDAILKRTFLIENAVLSLNFHTEAYASGEALDNHTEEFLVSVFLNNTDNLIIEDIFRVQNGDIVESYTPERKYLPEYSGKSLTVYQNGEYLYGKLIVRMICKEKSSDASTVDQVVITDASLSITPLLGLTTPKTEFRHKIFEYAAGGSKLVTSKLISAFIPSIQNRVTSVERFNATLTDFNPSKNLAQRMADYHGKPRKAYRLPLIGNFYNETITPIRYATYDGKRYFPIAVESDVKKECFTLTLIEMPTILET